MNVEPLESTFITSLTAAPRNSSCALSDSSYFSRKKLQSIDLIPIQFNLNQLQNNKSKRWIKVSEVQ